MTMGSVRPVENTASLLMEKMMTDRDLEAFNEDIVSRAIARQKTIQDRREEIAKYQRQIDLLNKLIALEHEQIGRQDIFEREQP